MTSDDARELLTSSIVVDGLNVSQWGDATTYQELRDGGVTAVNATLTVWDGFQSLIRHLEDWQEWLNSFSDSIRPVRTTSDIEAAKSEGRTGIIFGLQNASPLGDSVARTHLLHALGVRIIQLTYNERNLLGDGCYEPSNVGLSRFGRDVIKEMNTTGLLIDLSHCGDRTTLEAIDASEMPVAITHANARSQFDHPRNKTDEAIQLLAERNGVIGANAYPLFFPEGYDTQIDDYILAIEYLVDMVGIEHVAIGTDFCSGRSLEWFKWINSTSHGRHPLAALPSIPHPHRQLVGFEDARAFSDLTAGLLDRGYADADVRKVLGENWMRLFTEVWEL